MKFIEFPLESKMVGRKVIENGNNVGVITKVDKNPKGFGDVYHVKDSDGDEWTFNAGNIKSVSSSAITIKT